MSELKCCKICGAYYTCDHKGECCPECEHYDPLDNLCMAGHLKKRAKQASEAIQMEDDVDPETFLFDDDDEDEEDDSDLPPERDADDEMDIYDDDDDDGDWD